MNTDSERAGAWDNQPKGAWRRDPALWSGRLSRIDVDGQAIEGHEGECLATLLAVAGKLTMRRSPEGAPRGMVCLMGVCQECVVTVDGKRGPACMTFVRDGMQVLLGESGLTADHVDGKK